MAASTTVTKNSTRWVFDLGGWNGSIAPIGGPNACPFPIALPGGLEGRDLQQNLIAKMFTTMLIVLNLGYSKRIATRLIGDQGTRF